MVDSRFDFKKISVLLLVATVIALAVHLVSLDVFNKRENKVHGNDSTSASYMDIDARKDSTSTWVKRDYDLFGETVNITGATIDGELHNNSNDTISSWTLRINITGDCLINQAWNGEVEIHQYVGTSNEVVQRLNLQDYKIDDVKLRHLYDGDLLIPLKAGDYVVYYPNEKFKEQPLEGNDSVKIGVIFYYLDSIDLSDYDLDFKYHRGFTQGPTFLVLVLLAAMLFVSLLMFFSSSAAYRRAQNEMELRKSGLSWLSDMYAAIFVIDLTSGEMTPISVTERDKRERSWAPGARSFFEKVVEETDDAYKGVVSEFVDFGTLAQRASSSDSMVCEFMSKHYGWTSMRFFAMDRIAGQALEKVICTLQDVNEEKGQLESIEKRIVRVETETKARYGTIANVSQEIREPIREMLDFGERIKSESSEESIRSYAKNMLASGEDLLNFVNEVIDYSELEAGRTELRLVDYSLKGLVGDVADQAGAFLERRGLSFDLDVTTSLPSKLHGDESRLKQVVREIIMHQAESIEAGSVKLSIFGRVADEKAHLLISVRASGVNEVSGVAPLPERKHMHSFLDETSHPRMRLVAGLLKLMGSEVKTVKSDDNWHECYFEIEQDVVDTTSIGSCVEAES